MAGGPLDAEGTGTPSASPLPSSTFLQDCFIVDDSVEGTPLCSRQMRRMSA